MDVEDFD